MKYFHTMKYYETTLKRWKVDVDHLYACIMEGIPSCILLDEKGMLQKTLLIHLLKLMKALLLHLLALV